MGRGLRRGTLIRMLQATTSLLVQGLAIAAACTGAASLASAQPAPPADRPNIILIMTDDQGLGDLGFMGNPDLDTPEIDSLAEQSARFSRFYVSAVCAPTRASLMTGRYNYRTRVVDTWVGRSMMEPDEVTIAEVLGGAGYATGIFGKWHLGDCYPMRPIDQGFDESLVHRGGGLAQPSEPPENNRRYTDPILFRNGEQVQTTGYCTDVYFEAAGDFITARAQNDQPFFAYIAPNAPHDPYHDVPEELYEKYKAMDLSGQLPQNSKNADDLARVFAMVENIDENVGRLLRQLEQEGLADNTIVVYLHDNGPRVPHFTANLRGRKTMPYEGGVRSPLLVRWPGRVEPGTRVRRTAAHIDLLPTLLDAVGLDPAMQEALCANPIDGRSLWPLIQNPDAPWPERYLFFQTHRGDVPVPRHHFAVVGERWKLVRHSGFNFASPRDGTTIQLHDLAEDPREQRDLAQQEPEQFDAMLRAYDSWYTEVSGTRPDNYDPPRIVIGTDHETATTLTHQDSRRHFEGDFEAARWWLRAHGERRYTVRVLADTDPSPEHDRGTLTLHLGERAFVAPVPAGSRWTVFSGVPIPRGDLELWATYEGTPGFTTAYHVVITRED